MFCNSSCIKLVLLFLLCMTPLALQIHPANSEQTEIHIKADGNVEPGTAPIQRQGEVYTFTADIINQSVFIERSGITIDGAWHKLVGKGAFDINVTGGFKLNRVNGVTIKRVKISNSFSGILMSQCGNCVIRENQLTNNSYGIYMHGFCNNTLIERNRISHNIGMGVYLYGSFDFTIKSNLVTDNWPSGMRISSSTNFTMVDNVIANNQGSGLQLISSHNITLYHNNFVDNIRNVIPNSSTATWDSNYPSGGNYWSDYNGTDDNHDGIGDTHYTIDAGNVDHYPFMRPLKLCLTGDVNYDGVVNILDLTMLSSAYDSREGDLNWVPQADVAWPYGVINMLDVVTCMAHYAKTYP